MAGIGTIRGFRKFVVLSVLLIGLLSLVSMFIADLAVESSARGNTFDSVVEIPHNRVGLLLGTSKKLTNGQMNLYYKYRIEAAVRLFNSGKIDYILVSGDNRTRRYNEPQTIKKDLLDAGIPPGRIYQDYAGFRTLDSVIRCREIFGQQNFTVISQPFQNARALYIARWKSIRAVGYNARDVSFRYGFRTRTREKFARVKMFLDLVVHKKPKFLGEQIEIK